MQMVIDTEVNIAPAPHRRYAKAAEQMRAAGIEVRDDEYERIDALTSIESEMFLHLCGIAPFVVGVLALAEEKP